MGGASTLEGVNDAMGVDKEEHSCRCTKIFKGHFLKSEVTSLSTFKAEFISPVFLNCSV